MENSLSKEQFRPVMNETREIRVFLSSTFSDMQEERDALIKLFDKLRVIAFRRDVFLSVIDLRWGVTEEESKSGKVLSLCLNEIDKSRPFFIGLLGSKYGSCPEVNALDGNLSLLEQNPWLAEAIHENKSITEIEILYGALQNDKDTEAVFYIKENVNDENTKLTQLKQKLLNQTRFPVGMYSSIEGLCRQVEKDILLLLDTHFPDTGLTFLQKEKYIWQSYARIKHSHFIKREYYANQLYDFFSGNNNKLLLTGEKDSGKSAILSNYLLSDKRIDNFIVFCRFLDNPLARHDYQDVLRDLIAFLKECYGLSIEDEPSQSDEQQIASLIKKAARDNSRPPLLIVLDGLERLGAENALNLLYWLPDEKSVRYIVSTRLGTPYVNSVLCNRGFMEVEVSSPRLREFQLSFIQLFLSSVGKKLSDSQLSRILNDKENESISVLRALLNELVSFGSFEYLDDEIAFYTQSRSIEDFYNCIIEKKENHFSPKGIVQQVLSLIACSRYGLEEEEIISILGIRRIDWHFLYGSMFSYFFTQNGRIGLQSEDLSDVIIKRYLTNDPENVKNIRRRIVDCISPSTLMNKKEAAYQYYKLEDYKSLYATLLDIETTKALVDSEPILLSEFWMALKHSNDESIRFDGYLVPLSKMTDTKSLPYISIGHFFMSFMQDIPTFLLYCQSYIERILKEEGDLSSSLVPAFNSLGWYYYGKNDYQEAISYFNKSLSILKKLGKKSEPLYLGIEGWISGAKNFMSLSNDRWTFPNAIPVLKTIIYSIFHKRKLTLNDATYFSTLSLSAAENGMHKQAIRGLKKSYSIVSSIVGESHPKAANVLSDLASVYSKEGNLKKALELYEQALAIYRQSETNLISGARARNNIASVYQRMGDLDRAKDYYLEAVNAIEGNVEASSFAASVYCNLGSLYSIEGNNNDALEYIMKALSLWEGVYGKNSFETITPRYWLGYIFKNTGEYSKAILYFLQATNLQLQFNRPVAVRFSVLWSEIGACYVILGERIKAKDSYMQALSSLQDEVIKYSLNRIEAYKDEISIYTNLSSLNDDETISINYLKEASWRCKKVYGSNSREYALNCNSIGLAFIRRGRAISKKDDFDTAHYYLYKATTILTPLLGETHPDVLQVNVNFGIALEEKQNYSSAAYYYQQYIASIESGTDNDNEVVSDICARLADICIYHINSTNNAIYYASRALGIRNRLLGLHEKTASSWNQLGLAYYKNNQYTFAIESFIFAYVSFNALFGEDDANTQVTSNNIQQVYKDMSSSPDIAFKYYKEAYEELKNKYGEKDNSVQVAKSWMDWVNDVWIHH